MTRNKILSIVEGDGDVEALPILLRRLLFEVKERFEFHIDQPKNAHGCNNLTKFKGIERFLELCRADSSCAAILVLVDTDENCAKDLALDLAARARLLGLQIPIAIVCATCEYEAWFLASLETTANQSIKGRDGLTKDAKYEGEVENKRGVKEWLTQYMPLGRTYRDRTFAYLTPRPPLQYLERGRKTHLEVPSPCNGEGI